MIQRVMKASSQARPRVAMVKTVKNSQPRSTLSRPNSRATMKALAKLLTWTPGSTAAVSQMASEVTTQMRRRFSIPAAKRPSRAEANEIGRRAGNRAVPRREGGNFGSTLRLLPELAESEGARLRYFRITPLVAWVAAGVAAADPPTRSGPVSVPDPHGRRIIVELLPTNGFPDPPENVRGRVDEDGSERPDAAAGAAFAREAAGLIRIEVRDNIPATGVDAMSRTADLVNRGDKQDYWIMAPLQGPPLPGGFAYENLTQIRFDPLGGRQATLISDNATPNPAVIPMDGQFHDVMWQGSGPGIDDESRIRIQLDEDAREIPVSVQVKTMIHRTVNVRVHRIRNTNSGSRPFPAVNWNLLQTEVNKILAYQLNAWVNFQVDAAVVEHSYPPHSAYPSITNTFAALDDPGDADDLGYFALLADPKVAMGADNDIRLLVLDEITLADSSLGMSLVGHAANNTAPNTCLVLVRQRGGAPRSVEELRFTIAHEIGHVLVGLGHPDVDPLVAIVESRGGPAPLEALGLPEHQQRLMCSGANRLLGVSRLLVKAEWDKAEEWLRDNVDEPE